MLVELLSWEQRIEVVGEAENGVEAFALASWLRPDVILMDASMPLAGGLETAHRIRAAGIPAAIAIVSASELDSVVAHSAGVDAYLSKGGEPAELVGLVLELAATFGADAPMDGTS